MELKNLAWTVRFTAGDVSVMVSNPMSGLPVPPDAMAQYVAGVARIDATWSTLNAMAAALPLPPRFTDALNRAKAEFFSREFTELRFKTFKAVLAGEPTGFTVATWTPVTVPKLAILLGVAEAALDAADTTAACRGATDALTGASSKDSVLTRQIASVVATCTAHAQTAAPSASSAPDTSKKTL